MRNKKWEAIPDACIQEEPLIFYYKVKQICTAKKFLINLLTYYVNGVTIQIRSSEQFHRDEEAWSERSQDKAEGESHVQDRKSKQLHDVYANAELPGL